jgi:serine/tyrosine/threonine adenylyltransferase
MAEHQADFTATFRALCEASTDPSRDADVRALFSDPTAYDPWAQRWRARLAQEDDAPESRRTRMRSVNPAFIPRNHRIEAAIRDAEVGRYDAFHELNNVLARPFEDQPQSARYAQPPAPHEEVLQTFCGT